MTFRRAVLCGVAVLTIATGYPAGAVDRIPETSGVSGFANLGATYFNVKSNLIVGGEPVVFDEVSDRVIDSVFDPPSANSSLGAFAGGEIDYTFAGTRTQLFLGNRLEDVLRIDLVFGLGVRQEMGKAGILAASYLFTPVDLKLWTDPYVEGEAREPTKMDFPGFRLRWGQIFGTGLEITITDRFYQFDKETSGDWLIGEGRLDPDEQPLLDRDGDILRVQALYRIDIKERHRLEPAIRWVDDFHEGAAIANSGYSLQLTYIWRSPKVILDANIIYGVREADAVNPVYRKVLDSKRWATGVAAFIPVKRFKSSVLNVMVGGEVFEEDTNIDFYDSSVEMAFLGMLWRHLKK